MAMPDRHTEYWLKAIRAPGLRNSQLIEALGADGDLAALAGDGKAGRGASSAEIRRCLKNVPDRDIEADLEWLSGRDRCLLTWDRETYPALLRRIPSPPAALFVEGDANCLWQPQLAVIGSRNPTSGGLEHAREFTAELVRQGITITSGLASGIDSMAHRTALEHGGRTVAVCGSGPDIVYPADSAELARDIPRSGALVTEFPTGVPPRREHFPSRNRIISGLSLGVLVIEAGLNSGTLITARKAAEQGREVFALPGSLHNPLAKGCHRLIRDGARLVESVPDILSELGPMAARLAGELRAELAQDDERERGSGSRESESLPDDPEYRALWNALGFDPLHIDELVRISGLGAREVSSMLLMLEFRGLVRHQPGGCYAKTK